MVGDNTGNSSILAYYQLVYAKQLLLTDWLSKTLPKYVKTASSQRAKVKAATQARSTATDHRGAFGDDCEMKGETPSQNCFCIKNVFKKEADKNRQHLNAPSGV